MLSLKPVFVVYSVKKQRDCYDERFRGRCPVYSLLYDDDGMAVSYYRCNAEPVHDSWALFTINLRVEKNN